MAVERQFLADKSALARVRIAEIASFLEPLILSGRVATCAVIDLEVLFSARSYDDLVRTRRVRAKAFPNVPMTQADFDRAIEVMTELAKRGEHRVVGLPDLLIAAVAERRDLTVLHYDADYDRIAAVTGQKVEWVAPRGPVT